MLSFVPSSSVASFVSNTNTNRYWQPTQGHTSVFSYCCSPLQRQWAPAPPFEHLCSCWHKRRRWANWCCWLYTFLQLGQQCGRQWGWRRSPPWEHLLPRVAGSTQHLGPSCMTYPTGTGSGSISLLQQCYETNQGGEKAEKQKMERVMESQWTNIKERWLIRERQWIFDWIWSQKSDLLVLWCCVLFTVYVAAWLLWSRN